MNYVTEVPHKNVAAIDLFDGAQTVEHQEFVALSTSRLARRAREVRSTLERLQEGNYGVCEGCRNPIPAPRLAAVPTTTTCVACQSELEQRQREDSHPPSAANRRRSSAARAQIKDGITTRTSSIADVSRVARPKRTATGSRATHIKEGDLR
jgi:RNA polymerase-binding transcription factor DksA